MSETPQAKGGRARAEALSPTARIAIARTAAKARWSNNAPKPKGQDHAVVMIHGLVAAISMWRDEFCRSTSATSARDLLLGRLDGLIIGLLAIADIAGSES